GIFSGLPEGAVVTQGAYRFVLSYVGGDGNDVTLTCTFAPNVWTGAVNNHWAVAGNWSGGVPAAGDVLTFPAGAANTLMINDLAPDTAFNGIVFNGYGYRLGGARIVLSGGIANSFGNIFDLDIKLAADQAFNGGEFNGELDVGTHQLTLTWEGHFRGQLKGSGMVTSPMSSMHFYGTHPFGGALVGNTTLHDGAALPNASLQLPGNGYAGLSGNGTIGGAVSVSFLNPSGNNLMMPSPGVLNVGSLNMTGMTSNLFIMINGPSAGTGYSQ